ncbi:hypothetical protein BEWA_005750 [Theileria equi strain WA]|uniref:Uncharacterized protein n=1 Tax=Theileria equi strain WA TaxID=1537102 RepID=L0AZY1_THEEQ|nr:hypothetical protein BEWA_005750 [Theileria equi strain WA]AFZ81167.1 hypothetical protein BEWA_005750 [Theileria equi strain WA]|eukprot:XP_004830833.1 hypothetical protein BEWA_005750 [Theileria equi strain WA]
MVKFKLEPYGPGDCRVLRYLNGAIIREPSIQHLFTLESRKGVNKDENTSESVSADKNDESMELVDDTVAKNEENTTEIDKGDTENAHKDVINGTSTTIANTSRDDFARELHKANCTNWHMVASSICMASSLWIQKDIPLEWNEAKLDQVNGHNVLSKLKGIFDHLTESKGLQLSHVVAKSNNKYLKYAIFDRNECLKKYSNKALQVSDLLMNSLNIQTKFLQIIKEIKKEFKVLTSERNFVDLSSQDIDYPTSFSVMVAFFDLSYQPHSKDLNICIDYQSDDFSKPVELEEVDYDYNTKIEGEIWELWEIHNLASPYAPQQCLLSHYESSDDLETKLTFPQNVSYFIENDYGLSINASSIPLFNKGDSSNVHYQLRKAQTCLIDRLIYAILCQECFVSLKLGRNILYIGDSSVLIKYINSAQLLLVYKATEIQISYKSCDRVESGETIWKLAITKLRDILIQDWKRRSFLLDNRKDSMLRTFLKYVIKLIDYKTAQSMTT